MATDDGNGTRMSSVNGRSRNSKRNSAIAAERKAGAAIQELAVKFGLSPQWVSVVCSIEGVTSGEIAQGRRSRIQGRVKRCIESGMTSKETADSLGISRGRARQVARDMGRPFSGHQVDDVEMRKALELARQGCSKSEAARRLGRSVGAFTTWCRRENISHKFRDGRRRVSTT